jgi:hypothetical protein
MKQSFTNGENLSWKNIKEIIEKMTPEQLESSFSVKCENGEFYPMNKISILLNEEDEDAEIIGINSPFVEYEDFGEGLFE